MITDKIEQHFCIPFVDFKRRYAMFEKEIITAVNQVFSSGTYILGECVEEFEQRIAEYLNCRYVLGVANGTDAIILALKALDIGASDEVIVPVNSFIATAGAVNAVNAKPIFCDVTEDLNIDVKKLQSLITNKTKAIIPVHLTGRAASMEEILIIAKKYSLAVIEDAAQSIGATFQQKMTGTFGDVGCFSLHPLKNLYAYGDGGIMTTNDVALYNKLKLMRNHGLRDRDTCVCWGLNSRLDSVQAKLATIGLRYLDQWNVRRRQLAKKYQDSLQHIVKVPMDTKEYFSVYHNFVILTDHRDQLMNYLVTNGVETKIHYPVPIHLQPVADSLGYKPGDFPLAEKLAKQMLSLPIYSELMDKEVERIIELVQQFYRNK